MAKLPAASIVCIVVIAAGVLLYLLAIAGVLFAAPTAPSDIGALSILLVFVALGGLGLWASLSERRQLQ